MSRRIRIALLDSGINPSICCTKAVVGVDVINNYSQQKPSVAISDSIVNVLVPNRFYRTFWGVKKTILKGTSFACGYVTGLLSN